jgi:hypothetical protein
MLVQRQCEICGATLSLRAKRFCSQRCSGLWKSSAYKGGKNGIIRIDLTGQHFGHLEVLGFSHKGKWGQAFWKVRCSCGNEFKTSRLDQGKTRKCKQCALAILHEAKKKSGSALNLLWSSYKADARWKRVPFELTKEQFAELTSSPCFYTGRPPARVITSKGGDAYTYNGIDRKDSSKGYTEENCVPCCSEANWAKRTLTLNEFIKLCSEVAALHG